MGDDGQGGAGDHDADAADQQALLILLCLQAEEQTQQAGEAQGAADVEQALHHLVAGAAVHQGAEEDGREQDQAQQQRNAAEFAGGAGDGGRGLQLAGLGLVQAGDLDEQGGHGQDQQHEAHQRNALKGFLELPDLAGGVDGVEILGIVLEGRHVEIHGIASGGGGEVVPGVRLGRLEDDALAAVRGVIPGVGLGRLLLQPQKRLGRGHVVLFAHRAAGIVRRVEEELIILRGDLTHDASAAGRVRRGHVRAYKGGVGEVSAFGQAGVDLANTGGRKLLLVHPQRNRAGEAAHGVAGDADDAVAGLILQNVGLLIHVGNGVMLRPHPERQPHTEEVLPGVDGVVQVGVAVVILIQRQDHEAAAAELDGVGVLHLRGVQVAVGHHDGRAGILLRGALGHVQQAAERAVAAVKADAGDGDGALAAVEDAGQNAAHQDQHQRNGQQDQGTFLSFHAMSSFSILSYVSYGNYGDIIAS